MDNLYIEKIGAGEKYVFIPGITGTIHYWKPQLTPYKELGQFLLIDPLGFGRSPKPDTRYTVDKHVQALHQTLKDEGPFTIVGHSMGSLLALHFAVQYPQLVNRIILIGMPAFYSSVNAQTYFAKRLQFFMALPLLAAFSCILGRHALKMALPFIQNRKKSSSLWHPQVINDLLLHTSKSFQSSLWEVVYGSNIHEISRQLSEYIPVLCLHGKRDRSAPLDYMEQLVAKRQGWCMQTKDSGTHQIFLEHPAWCMDFILQTK